MTVKSMQPVSANQKLIANHVILNLLLAAAGAARGCCFCFAAAGFGVAVALSLPRPRVWPALLFSVSPPLGGHLLRGWFSVSLPRVWALLTLDLSFVVTGAVGGCCFCFAAANRG